MMKTVSQVRRGILFSWLGFFGSFLYLGLLLGLWAAVIRSAWSADWSQMSALMLVLLLLQKKGLK